MGYLAIPLFVKFCDNVSPNICIINKYYYAKNIISENLENGLR